MNMFGDSKAANVFRRWLLSARCTIKVLVEEVGNKGQRIGGKMWTVWGQRV
jgi:hypothetical protein